MLVARAGVSKKNITPNKRRLRNGERQFRDNTRRSGDTVRMESLGVAGFETQFSFDLFWAG